MNSDSQPVACIARFDPGGRFTFVNDRFCEMTGRTRDALLGGMDVRELVHPDDLPSYAALLESLFATGEPFVLEKRVLRACGSTAWVFESVTPVTDADGRVVGGMAVCVDITERKHIEEREQWHHDQLETLLNRAPLGVYLVDADFRICQVNPVALPVFGEIPGGVIDRDFDEVVRLIWEPHYAEEIIGIFRHTLETGESYFTERAEFRADRGITEYYEWRVDRIPLPDGRYGVVCYFRDISRQRQARLDIARSEARYRALFESIDEGFCILQLIFDDEQKPVDYRYIEINPAFEQQTGMKNALGKTIRELVPGIEEFWFDIYGKVALTGKPTHFVDHAKSMGRWFEVHAFRVGEPHERQIAVLFNDITRRKEAEAALAEMTAESERKRRLYETIISSTPDLVYVFDLDYRFTFANQALLKMWGRTLEESVGRNLLEIGYEPWHAEMHEREIDRVVATKQPIRGEVPFTHATLGRRIYDYIFVPVFNAAGEVEAVAGTTRDVTERRNAETALRESEERVRTLVEQVRDFAIFRTDRDGRPISWNIGVRHVLGFEKREFIGMDFEAIFTPEDVQDGVPEQELRIAAREGAASNDRWMRRKDGTRFWAGGTTTALHNATGELIGYTKVMRDLTDRRQAEEALREADRRKDEFLGMLAHELRNPLAPLHNGLQIIRLADHDAAAIEQARAMMERQLDQMVRLIDDLLDVSRISRGKIELRRERVEVMTALDNALETVRPLIEQAGHEFTMDVPDEPIHVDADITRLSQVFANILNNAAKFTPPGGHIALKLERRDDKSVVTIRDDGRGIPTHMLDAIFDLFTQVDQSLEKLHGGLGIGLSLVKRLVDLHGGEVEARSDGPGTGSEFIVRLPVAPFLRVGSRKSDDDPRKARDTGVHRILVVDDNRDAANSLAMVLKSLGNETQIAYDGFVALEQAAAFRPDLVLLDIGMPRMNGYDTARRLREQPWGKDMVLVALTGWGQDEDKRQSREAGFDFHMVKPIERATLESLLGDL